MNRRILALGAVAAAHLALTACAGITGNTLAANVDGTPWSAMNATVTDTGEVMGVTTRVIAGTNISETMTLTMVGIDGPGTWTIGSGDAPDANLHFNIGTNIDTDWDCVTDDDTAAGSLIIDTLDDAGATGTFSCTAIDGAGNSIEVTNGEFDVEWGVSIF